jgi:hypothetical protein
MGFPVRLEGKAIDVDKIKVLVVWKKAISTGLNSTWRGHGKSRDVCD